MTYTERDSLILRWNVKFSYLCLFCCDRYEGDKVVKEVRSDYVVWEETGRTDYGYTATMSEVRIMYQRNNCCSEHKG